MSSDAATGLSDPSRVLDELIAAYRNLCDNPWSSAAGKRWRACQELARAVGRLLDWERMNRQLAELQATLEEILSARKEGHSADLAAPFGVVDEVADDEDLDAGDFDDEGNPAED